MSLVGPVARFNPSEYWESRLSANYSLGGVGYLGLGEGYNRWTYKVRRRVIRDSIRNLPVTQDSARVLDVGSGTGFMIETWMGLRFRNIEGCDLTQVAVDGLRRRFPSLEFHRTDVTSETIPWRD